MKHQAFVALIAIFQVGNLLGCQTFRPPVVDPRCNVSAAWASVAGRDARSMPSVRLAMEVPEFGSAYVDTVLKVFLIDLSATDRARSVIDRYDLYESRGREVRFVRGAYSYRELRAYGECLLPYMPRGVASFRVSEQDNRDEFTVVNDEARRQLELVIDRLGMPRAAFIIKRGEYAPIANAS